MLVLVAGAAPKVSVVGIAPEVVSVVDVAPEVVWVVLQTLLFFNMCLPCLSLLFFILRTTYIFLKADMPLYTHLPHFYHMDYRCSPQGEHLFFTYLSQ